MRKHITQFVHRFGKPIRDWYAELLNLFKTRRRMWTDLATSCSKLFVATGIIGPFTSKMGLGPGFGILVLGLAIFYFVLKYGYNDDED